MHLPARIAALTCAAAITVAVGLPAASGAHPDRNHSARHDHGGGEGDGNGNGNGDGRHKIAHVLLLSVDGMHQSDLRWYVRNHPDSALARLAEGGTSYSHAMTPIPSDSFPGMVGQVTGGDPGVTGVYYDAEYNHNLLPAGTTSCTGQKTGAEVNYFEVLAKNPLALDSGQGLPGLPNSILQLTGTPQTPDRSGQAPGRSGHLQAGLPALLPEGQHGLQRAARCRSAHRVVRQACRLRDPQRAVGQRDRRSLRAGDQQRRTERRRNTRRRRWRLHGR